MIPWLVPFVCCTAAASQQSGTFSWRELPRADAIAVGLAWQRGFEEDLCAGLPGSSAVIAELRLLRARARVPKLIASAVHVERHATVVLGVVPAGAEAQAAELVRALLDNTPPSDDDVAQVIARTALAADDAEFLLPGDVLTRRAVTAFWCLPVVAWSTELAALRPAGVIDRMRRPVAVFGAVAGAVTPSLRQLLASVSLPASGVSDYSSVTFGPNAAGRGMVSEQHSRIDQPFVMAAFESPEQGLPAFAVAVEVARGRASKRFRYGGSELRARAPFVAWSWADGDTSLRFFRRGREPRKLIRGEPLEADAAAEAAATWSELAAFLDDLRERPPSSDELLRAKQTLLAELGLVIQDERPVTAAMLPGWLLVQLLGPRRGIDAAAINSVAAAAAHAALTAAIESGKGVYHELLPLPRADRTWPRRK